jgi:hypothetical protein
LEKFIRREILNCKEFGSFSNNDYRHLEIEVVGWGGVDAIDRASGIAIFWGD